MEPRSYARDQAPRSNPNDYGTPVYDVTNENWRGKNDPTERRRIQNRLNQRAFRQRQRAGESPKQYKPRSTSRRQSTPDDEFDEDDDDDDDDDDANGAPDADPYYGSASSTGLASHHSVALAGPPSDSERRWDELGRLINRNFMTAVATIAERLGISLDHVRSGGTILTPRPASGAVPALLRPIELQYRVPHDPIIDTIPHPRLRYNVLQAIVTRQIDAAAFSQSLRFSGCLEAVNEQWRRSGLVVWSDPEQLSSWEVSEHFYRLWVRLLAHGCEDLLAATNAWRSQRNEAPLPTSLFRYA